MFTDRTMLDINRIDAILTYHEVTDATALESQFAYLSADARNVLVTFDDGHRSVYEVAFPLLKKYELPAIVFIITGLVGTDTPFWWDEIRYYLGPEEGNAMVAQAKTWPNAKRLHYLSTLRTQSTKPALSQPQLAVDELVEMREAGVRIGNHSHTHPMFDQCTNEELQEELRKSRTFFEDAGLDGYELFAYPNGNHNETSERILSEHGIRNAFLFDHSLPETPVNRYRISRLSVNDDTPMWKFRLILSGLHSKMLPVTKRVGLVARWLNRKIAG